MHVWEERSRSRSCGGNHTNLEKVEINLTAIYCTDTDTTEPE